MQVFNLFMKVLKKNIFSSMIYIIVFVVISIPMARSASADKIFKDTALNIAIFDEDQTSDSKALEEFIGEKHKITKIKNDKDTIMQALYFETVDYVLIINEGYSKKLVDGDVSDLFSTYHMHESYATVMISQLLDSYINSVRAYLTCDFDLEDAERKAADAVLLQAEVTIARSKGSENFSSSIAAHFRYMTYILISVILSALCPVLLKLGSKEFRYRSNCSCIKQSSYSMQIIAGSALFISILWILLMIASVILNGGMFRGNAWYAVLNTLIYTAVCTSIALLICSFEPSDTVFSLLTQMIGLGSSFLCGVFVPQSMLSSGVLSAAKFLPAYWYVKVVEMLSGNENFDSSQLALYLFIEFGFAVAILLITLVVNRFKYTSTSFKLVKFEPQTQK